MRQRNSGLGEIWVLLAKDGNWLRIESGTNIELVLAKNKTGHEFRTQNNSGTSDMATSRIWNTWTRYLLIWY